MIYLFCLDTTFWIHLWTYELFSIHNRYYKGVPVRLFTIGIKDGFSCINIRQVPWEVLKTETECSGFQHLPRDLANVNTLKNHVWSLLLHKNWNICYISRYFLHYFVSPFHRCLANVISTDYAPSRAGQYTSRNGSKSVLLIHGFSPVNARLLITCDTAFYAIIAFVMLGRNFNTRHFVIFYYYPQIIVFKFSCKST